MTASAKDIYKLLDDIDHDARAIIAKHTELRAMLATISFPKESSVWICKECPGGLDLKGERALALHRQNVHNGPPVEPTELELLELAQDEAVT